MKLNLFCLALFFVSFFTRIGTIVMELDQMIHYSDYLHSDRNLQSILLEDKVTSTIQTTKYLKQQYRAYDCPAAQWALQVAAVYQNLVAKELRLSIDIKFSAQYILQCTGQYDDVCHQGSRSQGLRLALSQGLPLQKDIPFNPTIEYQNICSGNTYKKIKLSKKYFVDKVYKVYYDADLSNKCLLTNPSIQSDDLNPQQNYFQNNNVVSCQDRTCTRFVIHWQQGFQNIDDTIINPLPTVQPVNQY